MSYLPLARSWHPPLFTDIARFENTPEQYRYCPLRFIRGHLRNDSISEYTRAVRWLLLIMGRQTSKTYGGDRCRVPAAGRRLRDLAGRDRRGRDHIHPAALEPPHRSQGEQFLGVDACARVRVTSPPF